MQEIIVLMACLLNSGCTQTVGAYRYYNPGTIKQVEQNLEPVVEPYKTYAPLVICGSGSRCVFSLTDRFTISAEKDVYSLTYVVPLGK